MGVLRGQIFERRAERDEPNLPPESPFGYFRAIPKVTRRRQNEKEPPWFPTAVLERVISAQHGATVALQSGQDLLHFGVGHSHQMFPFDGAPRAILMLGGSEFRLRQGFAAQNACTR